MRVKINLEPNESFVVADSEFWNHMMFVCEELANQYERDTSGHRGWREVREFIRDQYMNNLYTDYDEEEDRW